MSKIESEILIPGADARHGPGDPGAGRNGVIASEALMNGRREVLILHAGERYRLRVTANDKLILTK